MAPKGCFKKNTHQKQKGQHKKWFLGSVPIYGWETLFPRAAKCAQVSSLQETISKKGQNTQIYNLKA
jgi:hypothetical protein